MAFQLKVALHVTISEKVSYVQVVHQLLAQLGIHVQFHWSRSVGGHEGEKLRVYAIDPEAWQRLSEILLHRAQKRATLGGSPLQEKSIQDQGDPGATLEAKPEAVTTTEEEQESLSEIRMFSHHLPMLNDGMDDQANYS